MVTNKTFRTLALQRKSACHPFILYKHTHLHLEHALCLIGDPAETDYTAVGCAVTTISSNLTEMSKGVKLLAALMEDEGGNGQQLLGAARNLACAVSDMLKTAQPASAEVPHELSYFSAQTHRQCISTRKVNMSMSFTASPEPPTGCR